MQLHAALNVVRGDVISFVGAGGKTSAMMCLGNELAAMGWRVLATTTTQITRDQLDEMPCALPAGSAMGEISDALNNCGYVFLYADLHDTIVTGPDIGYVSSLIDSVDSDVLLIEADHAGGRLLKGPAGDEPPIPLESSLVVPVVSIDILGKPLDDAYVSNPESIDDRYGFGVGNRVKSPWVAQVLRDEHLGLKAVPESARVMALINHVPEQGFLRGRARMIAQIALRVRYQKRSRRSERRLNGVLIANTSQENPVHEVQRPVAAIVLAGGLSTRMGRPKVLLPWADDRTIIEHILQQLFLTRLDQIYVVTGHEAERVSEIVLPLEVEVVYNAMYATGEMLSSLQAGLKALDDHIAAALIVLGDQPRIHPKTVAMVLSAYAEGAGEIVIPSYQMQRGHPLLLDRRYWQDMFALPDGAAPRDVIRAHTDKIAYVLVNNDSILRDVDTPEAYKQERRRAGLD